MHPRPARVNRPVLERAVGETTHLHDDPSTEAVRKNWRGGSARTGPRAATPSRKALNALKGSTAGVQYSASPAI